MNILIVNWSWYPTGGDWTYVETLKEHYESLGHQVVPFSMKHEKNFPSSFSNYFIDRIDYKQLANDKSLLNGFKSISKSVYSFEAKRKLEDILKTFPIDVAHLNNIHHYFSLSILSVLKKFGVKVIWTLHDYAILCPNSSFTRQGKVCEKCKNNKFYHAIINKCKKGSVAASAVASLESYVNWVSNSYKYVDYFICPSEFIRKKFIEYGFPSNRMIRIYNLAQQIPIAFFNDNSLMLEQSKYILYFGNLLRIKGIYTLIEAIKGSNIKLIVVGSGEHEEDIKRTVYYSNVTNIEFVGHKSKIEVYQYIKHSLFVVAPSEWYENFPYSVVESMQLGKPVIGANIGGIPELVIDGVTGVLFEPGNIEDLRSKINKMLMMSTCERREMGCNAQTHVSKLTSLNRFSSDLSDVYKKIGLTL